MVNKVLNQPETEITWLSAGGTELITLTSLAAGAGHQGAIHDFGLGPRARNFRWVAFIKFATTPVVSETVDIYLKQTWSETGTPTHPDNDDGLGDIALSAEDKLRNLQYIGSIEVDEASTTPEFVGSGIVRIDNRHAGPVFFNDTADALSATATDHGFEIKAVPDEIQ